jgi:hypothetical protein
LVQKIREVEELFLVLNQPLLVELEPTDSFEEEDLAGLGRKTNSPRDAGFLAAGLDVE